MKTEQKFTPIYSPQCNGRIEGFHKFLKATIAKQLEDHVEWDDLVWKAIAAYNFLDGNKKKKNIKEPEKQKIGDNVLVRDHTSKVFQPKYKDFGIVGLLGKNQIEIKDNHGHTTKVHRRDVKKIPMTEKVCQLYEEEQIGKVRQGRKAIPANKMPNLGWDAMEEVNTYDTPNKMTKDTAKKTSMVQVKKTNTMQVLPEAIMIVTFLEAKWEKT